MIEQMGLDSYKFLEHMFFLLSVSWPPQQNPCRQIYLHPEIKDSTRPEQTMVAFKNQLYSYSHRIQVWYIYLDLPDFTVRNNHSCR